MSDPSIGLLIIFGLTLIGFGFGYLAGNANPPKGEIILTTFAPHKCKGIPRKGGWYLGTQWKCNTCGDVWEVVSTYDGIESGLDWERLTVKGKKK